MDSSDKIRDAFGSIRADETLKSRTKEYLDKARQQECGRRKNRNAGEKTAVHFRGAIGILCAMLVLAVGAGGYVLLGMPVSYVSIDVNPSIELSLNRLDRVIAAEAYNEDGESILAAVSLRGLRYTEAIDRMVESDAMQPYLGRDAGLTFTVAADTKQCERRLLAGIEHTSGCRIFGGEGFCADMETVQEAHACGLSLGKYAAYRILSQYDSSITPEDCHHMSMSEIHRMIGEHMHGSGPGNGNGSENGAGEGNGYGNGPGEGNGLEDSCPGEGNGYGNGPGNGNGYGNSGPGEGNGFENGPGEGNGSGNGVGNGNGSGNGVGNGTNSHEGGGRHGNGRHEAGHGHH